VRAAGDKVPTFHVPCICDPIDYGANLAHCAEWIVRVAGQARRARGNRELRLRELAAAVEGADGYAAFFGPPRGVDLPP
jgi:hypothetical protein